MAFPSGFVNFRGRAGLLPVRLEGNYCRGILGRMRVTLVLALLLAVCSIPQPARVEAAVPPAKPCLLQGKVQVVDSFPDYKVKVVTSFPDAKVQVVTSFPDSPGKWQMVESFPDFKVQFVESFPDFTIQYVDSFPGCP